MYVEGAPVEAQPGPDTLQQIKDSISGGGQVVELMFLLLGAGLLYYLLANRQR